jgi:hypothetical protein
VTPETFSIGEIAIVIGDVNPRYLGEDVTVIGPLASYPCTEALTGIDTVHFAYKCSLADFERPAFIAPHFLRKKPQPGETRGALDSDATPNAPAQFDRAIWTPPAEILL